ncbi:MAG TPA: hypothetical protein V6D10_20155 [Trichocoleus sp.]|jgi:chromosome segregation ATPase
MTQDVRQWLAEIKTLQQKLSETQKERDEAYASAANWRNLYETEAKQRRTEIRLAQQTIDSLKSELQDLQSLPDGTDRPEAQTAIQQEINQLQDLQALQVRLTDALLECDRLVQALRTEQSAHQQTRKSLTAALGDTVDRLTQARRTRNPDQESGNPGQNIEGSNGINKDGANKPEARNPLLELPLFDSPQSRS